MTLRTLAAATLALALVTATACGSSAGDDATPATATMPPTTAASPTTPLAGSTPSASPSATVAAAATTPLAPGMVQFLDGKSRRTIPIAQAIAEAAQLVGFPVVQPASFVTGAKTLIGIQVSQDPGRGQDPLRQVLLTYSKDGRGPDPSKGEPYLRIIEADQVPNSNVGEPLPNPPPGVQVVKQMEPGRIIYLFQLEDRGVIFEFGGELPRDDAAVMAMYSSMK